MGKVSHWELRKKLKFDQWYIHNPESVVENDTYKLLWDFEIQMDHLISARQPDRIIFNKKERNCRIVYFAVLVDHRIKLKEYEKRDKYLNFARELKKAVEYESDDYTNCNWWSWYTHQRIGIRTGWLGNNGTDGDCPNYGMVEIGQNTEKSPGDLRRLAVTQTPVTKPSANADVENCQGVKTAITTIILMIIITLSQWKMLVVFCD